MNYSRVEFLVLFALFAALYWWIRSHRQRLLLLLAGSFAFYASGTAADLPVLLMVIAITYGAGLAIGRWDRRANTIAAVAVTLLVADLAAFKYSAFIAESLPSGMLALPTLLVPLGISFFTFEAIAYIIDLKRGMTDVERSPLNVALYIAFFPHLIAGPIMRADDLIPQLKRYVVWDTARFVSGVELLVEGLVKKRLLADPVGLIADAVFAAPATVGTPGAWIGVLAYTVQIYADFSGYTDMARGMARILGLELPKNFNGPYVAHSVSDFWQRWHITLSTWLRDYLWIPLGGLRHGRFRPYYTVFLTMLIGGLWHGAGWTFVAWGAYQGAWLAFERRWRWSDRLPRWLAIATTLFIIVNSWVLFRSQSFDAVWSLLNAMYVPHHGWLPTRRDIAYTLGAFVLIVGAMAVQRARPQIADALRQPSIGRGLMYGTLAAAAIIAAPTTTVPFIYFRF
ncbi:MAG: MBOAT family protein [Chloroflexi bacterium]|nr:MBOAT family protein [Chloroflexota bacterium]